MYLLDANTNDETDIVRQLCVIHELIRIRLFVNVLFIDLFVIGIFSTRQITSSLSY